MPSQSPVQLGEQRVARTGAVVRGIGVDAEQLRTSPPLAVLRESDDRPIALGDEEVLVVAGSRPLCSRRQASTA